MEGLSGVRNGKRFGRAPPNPNRTSLSYSEKMDVPSLFSPRLELISLSLEVIQALLGRPKTQPKTLPQLYFPYGGSGLSRHVLELREEQLLRDPLEQPWLLRTIVARDKPATLLGRIGFHAPPDFDGRVELGYEIFPPFRGQGYAQEAARAMMDWAELTHGTRRFLASVGPWNAPSLHIVHKLGFVRTGSQMDEIDGEEWVFERRV